MSGKRTKALRREFKRITGRDAVTEETRGVATFLRSVWDRTLGKRAKEAVKERLIVASRNEFRWFKQAGQTEEQAAADRVAFLRRVEAHEVEVERSNWRIAEARRIRGEAAA